MVTCHFCRCQVESVDAAVVRGWVPSFYYPGDEFETSEPVCAKCQDDYLEADESGELVCVVDIDPQFNPPRNRSPANGDQAR